MKFTCDKIPLINALIISSRAAVAKSPIPLLEGLLLSANGDNLTITGFDLKTGIVTNVEAEVEKPGGIVINAKILCDIVRKMPGHSITVEVKSGYIAEIYSERSKIDIIGSPISDYPELPAVDEEMSIDINQSVLRKMISQTNFAVSDNESRPIHTGALFETSDGNLTIVAVDGYRLALRCEPMNLDNELELSFVVPGTALSDVEHILSDDEESVTVLIGQKHVMFKIDSTTVVSRRLEGEFLDYKNSVPKTANFRIKIEKNDLIASLERVSLIISEKLKSPVRCIFEDGIIKLSSASALGKATDECSCTGDAKGLEIGLNDKYFIEALKAAPDDEVILELNSGTSPCVITPADDSSSFLYMILPVRLKAES